jgi:flagellar biosynthesis regulator FlaF
MGAAAAYGSVIRETDSPRDIEYRVLARATEQLSRATGATPSALAEAVHDNRTIWMAFATDLAHPDNAWHDEGKARMISLAGWVIAESERVMAGARSPDALIDINRAVMLGLRPETRTAPEPAA